MRILPLMNIRFSEDKEPEVVAAMKGHAGAPWRWQAVNTHGRKPDDGTYYFHRDETADDPPCTLCIHREEPGNLVVTAIVPDAVGPGPAVDRYAHILREFDEL